MNFKLFIVLNDPDSDEAQRLLRQLPESWFEEIVICPPSIRDLYEMPYIMASDGLMSSGLAGIRRFVEHHLNPQQM